MELHCYHAHNNFGRYSGHLHFLDGERVLSRPSIVMLNLLHCAFPLGGRVVYDFLILLEPKNSAITSLSKFCPWSE